LFATIGQLLKETNMTPADVAENLMPKSVAEKNNADTCLNNLIKCLEDAKEEAHLKAMKEASIKSNENGEKVQDGKVTRKSSNKSEENGKKVQYDEESSDEESGEEGSSVTRING
nr:AAA-ATPase ASD, mitochondrial-like [Tanacetum cinerariifolium]